MFKWKFTGKYKTDHGPMLTGVWKCEGPLNERIQRLVCIKKGSNLDSFDEGTSWYVDDNNYENWKLIDPVIKKDPRPDWF
jgi:hypothetical protein